ncbi:hypothetical protein PFISCL1PPCAC_4298, partial [Pristionchus fissidentatus]
HRLRCLLPPSPSSASDPRKGDLSHHLSLHTSLHLFSSEEEKSMLRVTCSHHIGSCPLLLDDAAHIPLDSR